MDIKGHTVHRVLVTQGARHRRGVLRLVPRSTVPTAPILAMASQGGRHGDRAARGRAPRGAGAGAGRRARPVSTTRRPARSWPPAASPTTSPTRWPTSWRSCGRSSPPRTPPWSRSTRWSRRRTAASSRSTARSRLDENAAFRHPEYEELADRTAADPLEQQAKAKNLNYVKLDGAVGIIGNGAGLVMSTLDVVAYAGEEFGGVRPANFLDIGGGASAEVMAERARRSSSPTRRSRAVFVNVFGGITACDAVANGIVQAFELLEQRGEPVTSRSSSGSTATTPTRVTRSSTRAALPGSSSGSTPWTAPPAARPSWPRPAEGGGLSDGDLAGPGPAGSWCRA